MRRILGIFNAFERKPLSTAGIDDQFAIHIIGFKPPALVIGFNWMASAIDESSAAMNAASELALTAPFALVSAVTKYFCCHGFNVTNPAASVPVNLHSSGLAPLVTLDSAVGRSVSFQRIDMT